MPGLSGFRDNETGHARANVATPPPTLVNLVTIGSLATLQILAQLAIIIIIIIKFIGHKIQLDAKITQKGAKAKNA